MGWRTAYYILGPWCDEINVCCFICVTQWWALHVVINHQFFLYFYNVLTYLLNYSLTYYLLHSDMWRHWFVAMVLSVCWLTVADRDFVPLFCQNFASIYRNLEICRSSQAPRKVVHPLVHQLQVFLENLTRSLIILCSQVFDLQAAFMRLGSFLTS